MQDSPIYLYTIRDASTSRTFRDQQFLKYLEGTFYRVNEIEQWWSNIILLWLIWQSVKNIVFVYDIVGHSETR